jgi:uncharacterized phosphatase
MKLYLVRHGQTTANAAGRAVGRGQDSLLTDQGLHDAQSAAEYLRDVPVDTIVSSPMTRARHTATIIRDAVAPRLAIEIMPEFTEINIGEATGWPLTKYRSIEQTGTPISGAETPQEIFERVTQGLHQLKNRTSTHLVLVSHGATSQMINCVLSGRPTTDFRLMVELHNGEVKEYEI